LTARPSDRFSGAGELVVVVLVGAAGGCEAGPVHDTSKAIVHAAISVLTRTPRSPLGPATVPVPATAAQMLTGMYADRGRWATR
jgi:hypothetical protein